MIYEAMMDEIAFMQKAILRLRRIAAGAPEIAEELHQIIEGQEERLAELARAQRDRLSRAGAP